MNIKFNDSRDEVDFSWFLTHCTQNFSRHLKKTEKIQGNLSKYLLHGPEVAQGLKFKGVNKNCKYKVQ